VIVHPTKIRSTIELYPSQAVHRVIVLLPVAYGAWSLLRGHELPLLYWCILAGTLLFHLFMKCPPYLRLSPTGLKFVQGDAPEVLWSDLKQVKSTPTCMELTLLTNETVNVEYGQLRGSDIQRLREVVKSQILAMSAEVKTLMAADPVSAVVNQQIETPPTAPA